MKVQTRHLLPDMVLKSSGAKVISVSNGVKVPRGKLNVHIEYSNGRQAIQQWGKYTWVNVRDEVKPVAINRRCSQDFADLYCDAAGNCYSDADPGL